MTYSINSSYLPNKFKYNHPTFNLFMDLNQFYNSAIATSKWKKSYSQAIF